MTLEELQIKKFELEQKIQLEELELKRKELELKIQEQKSKRVATPLVITIVGGLITVITSILVEYFENSATLKLEDKKFQSSLLLKATDAKTYDEFSDMLVALQENGLLSLDSAKIARFRKKRFVAEYSKAVAIDKAGEVSLANNAGPNVPEDVVSDSTKLTNALPKPNTAKTDDRPPKPAYVSSATWTIVSGADKSLAEATYEVKKANKKGFNDVIICLKDDLFRTCIGKYENYTDAVNELFEVKESLNGTSYIVNYSKWCKNWQFDESQNIYICK